MFIPKAFQETRVEVLHALISEHPFGLLITHGAGGLQVTPVPFLLYPDEGDCGVLRAHLARANPQWQDLVGGAECMVMFQGGNGYVTPSWYPSKVETHRVVPTWNYIAVEVRGAPRVSEDPAWLQRFLDDLTRSQESFRPDPWSVQDAPADYISGMLNAIVGIEIPIARLEGKWKISQNRPDADRQGVVRGMGNEDDPHTNAQLTAWMKGERG